MNGKKLAWDFALTILATVAVVQSLSEMIPQGGWIFLANYTAGLIALTLQGYVIFKASKRVK